MRTASKSILVFGSKLRKKNFQSSLGQLEDALMETHYDLVGSSGDEILKRF